MVLKKANWKGSSPLVLSQKKPIITVTMATSRQGSAVVRHLSKNGSFHVRAITRNPASECALTLSKLPNVEILQGDLLDKKSLKKSFRGAYGIFGNSTPTKGWKIFRGSMVKEYEIQQGRNLIDAVKEESNHGVLKHFIFSSICKPKNPLANANPPGHFSTKWSIEDYIRYHGLEKLSTILRPASYFENFNSKIPALEISKRFFPGIVSPNIPWQTIAVDDIGAWATGAFTHPSKFINQSINLATEELTGLEMASLLERLQGERNKVKYLFVPRVVIQAIEYDLGIMATWIENAGYGADIQYLQDLADSIGINMTPLSKWLTKKLSRFNPLIKEDALYPDFLDPVY